MSLTSALSIAQSALFNTSRQTSIVSRNVSEASNPDYTRRNAVLSSTAQGARVSHIGRATNEVLFRQNLFGISAWQGQASVSAGLDSLQMAVNGVENASSPATAIGKLQHAMQLYAATPSNRNLAESAVSAARNVVRSLNEGATNIQAFRADADREIKDAVDDLNRLLARFEKTNTEIVSGTKVGRDVSDALDERDSLLKRIAEHVPISTTVRAANDMVIMTADGSTLFETIARPVTFQANAVYTAGMSGNGVYVDGVPLQPGLGGNTDAAGTIAAKLQLRDDTAVHMQRQLDEIARGLITAFAETDPGGVQPDAAGLFTWPGGPAIPPAGTLVNGLAANIAINPAMDSSVGGNPALLRDGGANGAAYVHNTGSAASYSDLLLTYGSRLDAPVAFDPAAGLETSRSVSAFSADAVGWIESHRRDAAAGAQSKEAFAVRTASALSNATGVNVDEELSKLLDLEQSYEASARLLSVVDNMLSALMQAAR